MAVAFRSATRIASFFGAAEGDGAGSATSGRTPDVAGGGGSLRRLRTLSSFPPLPLSRVVSEDGDGEVLPRMEDSRGRLRFPAPAEKGHSWLHCGKGRPSGEPELPARADLAPFRSLDLVRLFDPHFCRAPAVMSPLESHIVVAWSVQQRRRMRLGGRLPTRGSARRRITLWPRHLPEILPIRNLF